MASRPPRKTRDSDKKHILTVSVEDYFHVGALEGAVRRKHWTRCESRLERNLDDVLEMLRRFDARATFFVFGWIAERQPELVARIVAAGHEVASRGYWPGRKICSGPEELREDLRRSKEVLEAAGAHPIAGYRSPRWLKEEDLWVLDVLAEEGYVYDSSLIPILRRFAQDPRIAEVHKRRHTASALGLWEFPISTVQVLGLRVAISGGNYLRQLPHALLRRFVSRWDRKREAPLVFYFMPWEMDENEPQIMSISTMNRIRHYRNLGKTRWLLEYYLGTYRFEAIGDRLAIDRTVQSEPAPAAVTSIQVFGLDGSAQPALERVPVTLVVPLYNEETNVAYLRRTLQELRDCLGPRYRILINLVDDGSRDGTWSELESKFSDVPDCTLLRHPENRGVAAAILTGIEHASSEIVCSIDCDCSYDPNELVAMIPLLRDADLVTASPYHPAGRVLNVPAWRLVLSKTLSRLYSFFLRERIHTFTSCCRVYRKSALDGMKIRHGGFLGIAEMLIQLKLGGGRVVEHPATLESRLFGESKMKILRTIWSHLGLLKELAGRRIVSPSPAARDRAEIDRP